jgi:hypothetical protein
MMNPQITWWWLVTAGNEKRESLVERQSTKGMNDPLQVWEPGIANTQRLK